MSSRFQRRLHDTTTWSASKDGAYVDEVHVNKSNDADDDIRDVGNLNDDVGEAS